LATTEDSLHKFGRPNSIVMAILTVEHNWLVKCSVM